MDTPIDSLTSHQLFSVEVDESLIAAYTLMRQNKIRHLAVREGDGVIGIISDRDIQRGMRTQIFKMEGREIIETTIPSDLSVRQLMSWPIKAVGADVSIQEVNRQMIREKISAFLVKKDDVLIGIVTHEDLLVYLDSLLSKEEKTSPILARLEDLMSQPTIGNLVQQLSNTGI